MPAHRQFEIDDISNRIMVVFWANGFGRTSIEDLESATGLRRGSLYHTFGSKEEMFLMSLDLYSGRIEDMVLSAFETGDLQSGLTTIFERMVGGLSNPATPPGCLIANTLAEGSCRQDAVGDAIRARIRLSEDRIYAALLQAQAEGRLATGRDLRALSRFFLSIVRILSLMFSVTRDPQVSRDIGSVALLALDAYAPEVTQH